MSRINIAFGTRMGYGDHLDEGVAFSPDAICQQCLAIFERVFENGANDQNVLHIDHRYPRECRLCVLLISKFHSFETSPPLRIQYFLVARYGHFFQVHDIMFCPIGAEFQDTKVVRLGLQMTKLDKDDGDHPPMVHFEPEISSSTDSEESMAQAARWFKECSENHEGCKAAFPKTSFVPTRLVEISGSDENSLSICLKERKTLPPEVCYATLSHCWGSTMPFMLKLERLDSCFSYIPLNELSGVFRDAIKFAWRLCIQYLWIDSLCIIQDSIEDWTAESSQMGSIYHHCILNIAATGFPDGEKGLFVKRDSNLMTPIALYIETDHRQKALRKREYYLVDTFTWKDGVDQSPLCERGWVTQERALSVRTIHFGKQQLFWECMCENASEVFPKGLLCGTMIQNPKIFIRSGTRDKEKRTENLQSIRKDILINEDFRARVRELKDKYPSICEDSSEEDELDEELSDRDFAKRMKALQVNGQPPVEESSESSDSDTNYEYGSSKVFKKRKLFRRSMKSLGLSPRDFDDCDLNILDGLDIKGWKKFKTKMEGWGFGAQSSHIEPLPFRGMAYELSQWVTVVEIFSPCSLTFSKDRLVAISGMAQSLSQKLNCDYLAGLWRRDLEHQVLWKVTRPFRAPKKDGTRGPSWSWASVDGAIKIPDWSGYFCPEPGDITWLARVDDASVHLAETGKFGQARSGSMTLTGRLGVFRIDKEKLGNPVNGNGNLIRTQRWVVASWDTQELEAIFGKSGQNTVLWRYSTYGTGKGSSGSMNSLDVFYLPVRVMDADPDESDYELPMLTGLLLLPTGKQKGLYRRVGQFELSEQWLRGGKESIEPLTESTSILDTRFFVSKHKHGQYTICIV